MKKKSPPSGNPRRIAAQVVGRVIYDDAFVSPALHAALARSHLDHRDKALCTELVYGTLRWQSALAASLKKASDKPGKKIDKRVFPHLLVAAYQMQHLKNRIPSRAAVHAAVAEVKKARSGLSGLANALLRNLGAPLHSLLPPDCADLALLAEAYGLPPWLAEILVEGLPKKEWKQALAFCNERPALGLYALGDEAVKADWLRQVKEEGLKIRSHPFVPDAYVMDGGGAVAQLPGFSAGRFLVADPASCAVALLLAPGANDKVVDLCAAPGGKTMILSSLMGGGTSLRAVEIHNEKAQRIEENSRRLGLPAKVTVADAREWAQDSQRQGTFDRVLLDAPCTGLGTIRRRPEIRHRRNLDDLGAHTEVQDALLEAASGLLKVGGHLVYSVCSPLPKEGKGRVASFLDRHPHMTRVPAVENLPQLPADAVNAEGEVRFIPHRHQTDAFFAALLTRNS